MFRAAALRDCLSELGTQTTAAAAALRARTYLRLGDPERGLTAASAPATQPRSDRESGELALLRGVALSRLGDDEASASALVDANVFGISSGDAGLEAEIAFYRGHIAFGEGDLNGARLACRRAFDCAALPAPTYALLAEGSVPLAHVVARTHELSGLIEAADGRYRDWLPLARQTLATLDDCSIDDVFQQSFAIANLAVLARDFDLRDDSRALKERYESLAWTPELAHQQFRTIHALAWSAAISGDAVEALRRLRSTADASSSPAERVFVASARAIIARERGHGDMAIEEIEHAIRLSTTFDWETAPGDTRNALLEAAHTAASVDVAGARSLLRRYRSIQTAMNVSFASRLEPRARAEEAYAEGVILRAEGRIDASTERLQVAFKTWEDTGYEWRAALAALELAELHAGDVFRIAVRRELAHRPDSVFATRARLVA